MGNLTQEARRLTAERRCFLCEHVIPPNAGVYHAGHRIMLCYGTCRLVAASIEKDYTASKRGKFRRTREYLQLLAGKRPIDIRPGGT